MCARAEDTVIIRNIYYMMAYAFRTIDIAEYKWLQAEPFDNLLDLLAAILSTGLSTQRRKGFEKEYETKEDDLQRIAGRIDIRKTAALKMSKRLGAHCVFDERTENTYKNRILKTTAWHLLRSDEVAKPRKQALKRSLLMMQDIESLDPLRIEWGSLRYHRNNRSYQLLMNVCYMVLHELLPRNQHGNVKLASMIDKDKLNKLYEGFILEYFRKHHPQLKPHAPEIKRDIEGDEPWFLPKMKTDVTLTSESQQLIIDAKCYGTILGSNFGKLSISSGNTYQIFSYVMHASREFDGDVAGMLLYAQTKDEPLFDEQWTDMGHRYHLRTLDLDNDFEQIAKQLDEIAEMI